MTSRAPCRGYSLDETTAQGFGSVCREMNLTNEQANTMAKFGFDFIGQIQAAQEAQALQQSKDWAMQTRTELGANFERLFPLQGQGLNAWKGRFLNSDLSLTRTGWATASRL